MANKAYMFEVIVDRPNEVPPKAFKGMTPQTGSQETRARRRLLESLHTDHIYPTSISCVAIAPMSQGQLSGPWESASDA